MSSFCTKFAVEIAVDTNLRAVNFKTQQKSRSLLRRILRISYGFWTLHCMSFFQSKEAHKVESSESRRAQYKFYRLFSRKQQQQRQQQQQQQQAPDSFLGLCQQSNGTVEHKERNLCKRRELIGWNHSFSASLLFHDNNQQCSLCIWGLVAVVISHCQHDKMATKVNATMGVIWCWMSGGSGQGCLSYNLGHRDDKPQQPTVL